MEDELGSAKAALQEVMSFMQAPRSTMQQLALMWGLQDERRSQFDAIIISMHNEQMLRPKRRLRTEDSDGRHSHWA